MRSLLVALLLVTSCLAVIRLDGGSRRSGYYGGGDSSSSSSESWEHGHGGHGHGGHGHPPHRPPPNRPPPPPSTPEWVCEDGWTKYMRSNYAWCIKVYSSQISTQPLQAQASANCIAMGAALTGYQNYEERMGTANEALAMLPSLGVNVGGLWVGAALYNGCMNPSCGPNNTFYWTDGSTTGYDGFGWGIGEPDNINWTPPACIQQFIMTPAAYSDPTVFTAWKTTFRNGDLDKYTCMTGWPNQRFYACGKRGTLVNN